MLIRSLIGGAAALAITAGLAVNAHALTLDFENGDAGWEYIDEDASNLGDATPGSWEIRASEFGLDDSALYQGSNIWGSPGDTMLMGTFAIYTAETFGDFTLTIDVAAADNDAMGVVWGYSATDSHYRINMINDGWPSPPLDGNSGPMVVMHKRISDTEPWYELLGVQNPDTGYVNYPEDGSRMVWTLTVEGGSFTFESDHGATVSGQDTAYTGGSIGLQMYAQQAEFDNIVVTPADATAVDPEGKAATSWADVKAAR
ncbi:hypothetical protein HOI71_01350 [Candidatus Poribacteria bacterium]|nr:hypothetical protein [Candidatus Poribacteria bacterium]